MTSRSVQAWEIAAEALGLRAEPRVRPNPLLWLWYAHWGRLPARHAIWVLFDTTCATWVARYFARILTAAVVPVAAIAIFLPADGATRAWTAFAAGSCAVLFTAVWVNESTDQRLVQAGFDWGVGPELRAKRAEIAQRLRAW